MKVTARMMSPKQMQENHKPRAAVRAKSKRRMAHVRAKKAGKC